MKHFVALAAVVLCGVFAFYEAYAFVTRHVGKNPFVNSRRFFRRALATFCLLSSFLLVIYFDEITGWLGGMAWKVSILGVILIFLLVAFALALRDAIKTARIAAQQDAIFKIESARVFREKLQQIETQGDTKTRRKKTND